MFWIIILCLTVLFLFILPLIPGIMELVRPTDIEPLRVSQDYDSDPYFFADGFRNYIRTNFGDIHSTQNHNGRLQDNTRYQLVGEKGIPNLDATTITNKIMLSAHPLNLPAGELFETEVYGRQNIMTGERSSYRAIMADTSLMLREHCNVMRWAHSDGEMIVGRHSELYGRATSRHSILLNNAVRFERLHAPKIVTTAPSDPVFAPADEPLTVLENLDDVRMQSGRRWVLNGHLEFPAKHSFDGDIVSGTTATVGAYSHIKGSIKANAHDDIAHHLQRSRIQAAERRVALFKIEDHVRIDGSIVSSHDLFIGQHCQIYGPVIAEGLLIIGAGTIIGSPDHLTTVSAPRIIIESGCVIHGTLWASEEGVVRPAGEALLHLGEEELDEDEYYDDEEDSKKSEEARA